MSMLQSIAMIKLGDIHPIRGWAAVEKSCRLCQGKFVGFYVHKHCNGCDKKARRRILNREMSCESCEVKFIAKGSGRIKFCLACRDRKNRKSHERSCVQCGSLFRPCEKRPDAKLCSRKCQGFWINANGLGPKHDTETLRNLLVTTVKRLGIPMSSDEVLRAAGVGQKTLTTRGWKMSEIYAEAGVVFPNVFASRFEARVYEVLLTIFGKNAVEAQKNFPDLRSAKNAVMWFDFWVPTKNLIVEADGVQHTGKTKFFDSTLANDKVKNQYCADRGIKILRIRYSRQLSRKKLREEIVKFIAPA